MTEITFNFVMRYNTCICSIDSDGHSINHLPIGKGEACSMFGMNYTAVTTWFSNKRQEKRRKVAHGAGGRRVVVEALDRNDNSMIKSESDILHIDNDEEDEEQQHNHHQHQQQQQSSRYGSNTPTSSSSYTSSDSTKVCFNSLPQIPCRSITQCTDCDRLTILELKK
ncbi:hypothetical protein PPL_05253 [Heterostelium album PN500]|uniref:Homeobox domain-containing protein n=1 Tax=Heterostelium pallidum (strain ATCC 26659 / Pp 5 / PN500) TaxID=670386 RepID=D3B9V5_HETP5|nr:hypothetical protein PPL_05253 [Heterostelium album PN500]EFA82017.1 hypothetical protein PPL_05253 [Heterostelium album PN500]|eukprot:XP_020434134.1 hypothetical protein PPL_05253 [Heterostelium album PN500]